MPEYKIEFTHRSYEAMNACVEADTPKKALKAFLDNPGDFEWDDDGYAGDPDGGQPAKVLPETAQVVGRWVESTQRAGSSSLRTFRAPVKPKATRDPYEPRRGSVCQQVYVGRGAVIVDWQALRQQRRLLADMTMNPEQHGLSKNKRAMLEGIQGLLDAFVDESAKVLGNKVVFGTVRQK